MQFTGERYIPTEQGQIRLEHYHRYATVREIVSGRDVLDVACGEGYGSFCLSEKARLVVGVDISQEAVGHARVRYAKPNLAFCAGHAAALAFDEDSFDAVISFETIEHLAEQAQMLSEIRRVLRPDGVFVISSPNRPIFSAESDEHNAYHVKELDFLEFNALLTAQFSSIQYFGQRLSIGSVIQALEDETSTFDVWSDRAGQLAQVAPSLLDPVYFLAVCSANPMSRPMLTASVFYPNDLDLIKRYTEFAKSAHLLSSALAQQSPLQAEDNQAGRHPDERIIHLEQAIERLKDQSARAPQAMKDCIALLAELIHAANTRDAQINALMRSRSWRITLPLRRLTEALRRTRQGTLDGIRFGIRAGLRSIWSRLPIPVSYRLRVKSAVLRLARPKSRYPD